jgi:hypothetical protein
MCQALETMAMYVMMDYDDEMYGNLGIMEDNSCK